MLLQHRLLYIFLFVSLLTLVGCSSKKVIYSGITYPYTTSVKFTFQEPAIPRECKVFSHAIISTPAVTHNLDIKNAISEDAKGKGADLVFVGLARTIQKGDAPDAFTFRAYGPKKEYPFTRKWVEWEFGFKEWSKGDELINLGYDNYNNPDVTYESGIMIKHVLLKCPHVR